MLKTVFVTLCMLGAASAIFNSMAQTYTLHNGRTVNFRGMDLKSVCRQAIVQMGFRITDQLSDVMSSAARNLQTIHGPNINRIVGTDPMWKCLAGRSPMGGMANAVGDYFDTAVEALHRPANPLEYCNVACNDVATASCKTERGINANAFTQNMRLMSKLGNMFGGKRGRTPSTQSAAGGATPAAGAGGSTGLNLANMMGGTPATGAAGSNPLAAVMGGNPMAAMMGGNPLAAMMNPMGLMGGDAGPSPMAALGANPMAMFGKMMGSMGGSPATPGQSASGSTPSGTNAGGSGSGSTGTEATSNSNTNPSTAQSSTSQSAPTPANNANPFAGMMSGMSSMMPGLSSMMPGMSPQGGMFSQLTSALGNNPFSPGRPMAQNPGAAMQNMFQMATVFGPDGLLQDGPPGADMGVGGLGAAAGGMGGMAGGMIPPMGNVMSQMSAMMPQMGGMMPPMGGMTPQMGGGLNSLMGSLSSMMGNPGAATPNNNNGASSGGTPTSAAAPSSGSGGSMPTFGGMSLPFSMMG